MKQWRMRTTLMVSLLAVSLGLTFTCLFIIRVTVQQEISKSLQADLSHSLTTFRNLANQRNHMLGREAALLADLPSLKALMSTQDAHTIQDGSHEFWATSGSDFFALTTTNGTLFTYSNRGPKLSDVSVTRGLQACMAYAEEACMIAFGQSLYELSIQPLYFGPPENGSYLGYVIIGDAIDRQVASEVSEAAAADVTFLINGEVAATTLPVNRLNDLRQQSTTLDPVSAAPRQMQLDGEAYIAAAATLPAAGQARIQIVVLKSYDRASEYLRRVSRWVLALGLATLLTGLVLAVAISRTVTRPLETLVAGTRALGQGDFDYALSVDGAAEVRELALAFDRMRGELKRTHQELLESDRLATIGRMASSVSHDLRHHLSAIYANAEFMSLPQTGADERAELHLEVQEAVQSMTDMIESLLLFSQTGQMLNLRREPVDGLVERTIQTVRQHPECREVQFSAEIPGPIYAWIDSKKLARAIYNLLLNACQSAKAGTGLPKVAVRVFEDNDKIEITIRDSGPGVAESIRETLFKPFVSAGKENGVGLGLTLAQHVAQEHGGEVRLEKSVPGETIFSILLYKQALEAFGHTKVESVKVNTFQE
jgi:signal transduction histidine kinase